MPPLFLKTIEQTGLSIWLRESNSILGFWLVLTLHAIGMGLLVGASGIIALRVLGVARDLPLLVLRRLHPVVWSGFWLQVATGAVLLIAYPTKSLTTFSFYVKIACIALGMLATLRIAPTLESKAAGEHSAGPSGRLLATWSLVFWCGAITAGRLIGYTATYISYPE